MNEHMPENNEAIYQPETLQALFHELEDAHRFFSEEGRGSEFQNINHIIETYQEFFNPDEEHHNRSDLENLFGNTETAEKLRSGEIINYIIEEQREDTSFGFAFEEEEIAALHSYVQSEQLKVGRETIPELDLQNKALEVSIKAVLIEEMQRLVEEDAMETNEFKLLEREYITTEHMMEVLMNWATKHKLDEISNEDIDRLETFVLGDQHLKEQFDTFFAETGEDFRAFVQFRSAELQGESLKEKYDIKSQFATFFATDRAVSLLRENKADVLAQLAKLYEAHHAFSEEVDYYLSHYQQKNPNEFGSTAEKLQFLSTLQPAFAVRLIQKFITNAEMRHLGSPAELDRSERRKRRRKRRS